jgi:hypothetical protein
VTGHVFHPGHHELHGITVVVETSGPATYVGRFDSVEAQEILLKDVGVHRSDVAGMSKQEYLERSARFGIRVEHRQLRLASEQVSRITPLGQIRL